MREDRNFTIEGSVIIYDRPQIGSMVYEPQETYFVPDFSKMSISQAIKTSESKKDTFEELFELCRKWKYRSWENETEFWFEPIGLIPAFLSTKNIVYVDKHNKVIYKKNNEIIPNKRELIDYIDSWWH